MSPFFRRSSFASFVFLTAASFLAILLSACVVDSQFGIVSGFGGGSSCTGAVSDNRMFGPQFSLNDTARKIDLSIPLMDMEVRLTPK